MKELIKEYGLTRDRFLTALSTVRGNQKVTSDNPEAILIDRENMDGMEYKINKVLSKLETEVLVYYLEGLSYQEIAEKLGKDTKAVDNAVQRIKKKLESTLREGNEGNY